MKISTMTKGALSMALLSFSFAAAAETPVLGLLSTAEPSAQEQGAIDCFKALYPEGIVSTNVDDLKGADVIWVNVDRCGIEAGKENLPAEIVAAAPALAEYYNNGGALYITKMATQLSTDLGVTPEGFASGDCFNSGEGAVGGDGWGIMPQLGWRYRVGGAAEGQEGYYDMRNHPVFEGIELTNPNEWVEGEDGFLGAYLIGKSFREDHNCLWDCNRFRADAVSKVLDEYGEYEEVFDKGYSDVLDYFMQKTNSKVLATWGHVQDHCVAGLVEFNPEKGHGTAIANGFAAYQFQDDNEYKANVEKLTSNTLNYLAAATAGVAAVEAASEAAPVYYNIQGVRVAEPANGLYIRVANGKATKVLVK